jgi:hypothetical protein
VWGVVGEPQPGCGSPTTPHFHLLFEKLQNIGYSRINRKISLFRLKVKEPKSLSPSVKTEKLNKKLAKRIPSPADFTTAIEKLAY